MPPYVRIYSYTVERGTLMLVCWARIGDQKFGLTMGVSELERSRAQDWHAKAIARRMRQKWDRGLEGPKRHVLCTYCGEYSTGSPCGKCYAKHMGSHSLYKEPSTPRIPW